MSVVLPSRAQLCVEGKNKNAPLQDWHANAMEAGKFFPESSSGLKDPLAKDDIPNAIPPADGKIASAGQEQSKVLDQAGSTRWFKTPVPNGSDVEVTWTDHTKHLTRRWNYFITKEHWNPEAVLTRAQFEPQPLYKVEKSAQPFWSNRAELTSANLTTHRLRLPKRTGYHVILGVWEVADTGNAFYQVFDINVRGS